jgi:mannose-6-phosphate isomerase
MFVRIDNTPRDYAWGSTTAIADLLGRPASGRPEAELWLGAHPGSPARILDPERTGGAADLAEWIERDPSTALGEGLAGAAGGPPRLTFLFKVLAAASPLSLQAHPSSSQAQEGYDRENAAGVPLDAPERNYKDAFHKPEMLYALSATFDALCGFRELTDTVRDLDRMLAAADAVGAPSAELAAFRNRLNVRTDAEQILRPTVEWLLSGADRARVSALVDEAVAAAELVVAGHDAGDGDAGDGNAGGGDAGHDASGGDIRPFATVGVLARDYPGDPGIVLSLLLHRVTLRRGEALYLPAGNIHAYLEGLGVEVMAASDNVMRGGLTPKHIDVAELLHVLQFTPLPVPYLQPESRHGDVEIYEPDVPDFRLAHVTVGTGADAVDAEESRIRLDGPGIALCTEGSIRLRGERGEITLRRGESVYVTPEEEALLVVGDGTAFIATENL